MCVCRIFTYLLTYLLHLRCQKSYSCFVIVKLAKLNYEFFELDRVFTVEIA